MSKDNFSERQEKEVVKTETEYVIRWYHIAATAVVLVLVICAVVTFFRRFNPTLVSSDYTLKIAAHCDGQNAEDRYFGVKADEMYAATESGDISKTNNRDEALLEITRLGKSSADVKIKNAQGEWSKKTFNFGAVQSDTVSENESCKLILDYTFSM